MFFLPDGDDIEPREPQTVGELLLSEQAAAVCPIDDLGAVDAVVCVLAERERMAESEAFLSEEIRAALRAVPERSREFLEGLRDQRDRARAAHVANMNLAVRLALHDWRPLSWPN